MASVKISFLQHLTTVELGLFNVKPLTAHLWLHKSTATLHIKRQNCRGDWKLRACNSLGSKVIFSFKRRNKRNTRQLLLRMDRPQNVWHYAIIHSTENQLKILNLYSYNLKSNGTSKTQMVRLFSNKLLSFFIQQRRNEVWKSIHNRPPVNSKFVRQMSPLDSHLRSSVLLVARKTLSI